jgi:hypothetical protein
MLFAMAEIERIDVSVVRIEAKGALPHGGNGKRGAREPRGAVKARGLGIGR